MMAPPMDADSNNDDDGFDRCLHHRVQCAAPILATGPSNAADGGCATMNSSPMILSDRSSCCSQCANHTISAANNRDDNSRRLSSCMNGRDQTRSRGGRRRTIKSTMKTTRQIMFMISLLFIGSNAYPRTIPPRTGSNTHSTTIRTLQTSTLPCEERTNQGLCRNNAQGNTDINCLWTSNSKCITLPLPSGTAPFLAPSYSPSTTTRQPATGAPVALSWGPSTTTRQPSTLRKTNEPTTTTRQPATGAPTTGEPSSQPVTGAPSRRPTFKPTRRPTHEPTHEPTTDQPSDRPSASPTTKRPTGYPTNYPTGRPSVSPSGMPSMGPTLSPTDEPTARPSKSPTPLPSPVPSIMPSSGPSDSPSATPTQTPTINPTQNPTTSEPPTPLIWPSASPTVSTSPTSNPTLVPSANPSASPTGTPSASPTTFSPTEAPTREPATAEPTVNPTPNPFVVPTDPPVTALPTRTKTEMPTVPNTIYTVPSTMVLYGAFGELNRRAELAWRAETTDRIEGETRAIIGDGGYGLDVKVVLDYQSVLDGRRMLRITYESNEDDHHLRRLQTSQLQLNFTTTIKFNSEKSDWDPNQMVATGFQSLTHQNEYLYSLKAADSASFEGVDKMTMEVDGVSITGTETEDSNEMKSVVGDNTWYIIGGAAGGGLLLMMAGAILYTRRRKDDTSSPTKAAPQDATLAPTLASRPPGQASQPPPRAYQEKPQLPPMPPAQNYFGTIETGEDDVSTLGDPYFGEGVVNPGEPRADETVAESMISSEQEMYVFGVGRQRLNTGGGSTLVGSTMSNPKMMFGDDRTLEDAYRTPDHGASNRNRGGNSGEASGLERLVVEAPTGKLGIVIDNPTGDLPVVHAIKETSVLHGRVNVGDKLVSMDETDCRGLTAVQMSRLISSRSNNPARTFVLLRGLSGSCC